MRTLILSLVCSAFLLGCGGNDDNNDPTGPAVFGKSYSLVDGDLDVGDDKVSGNGVIAFGAFIDSPTEGRNFLITSTIEDGGFVQLHAFANQDLSNAAVIRLSREGEALNYRAFGQEQDDQGVLTGVNASEPITLSVEVHNGESPAHVLLWNGDTPPAGEPLELRAANGTGTYVGFTLEQASLQAFTDGPEEIADDE